MSNGIKPGICVGLWHDSATEVAPESLRSDAAIVVDKDFDFPNLVAPEKEGDLHILEIPEDYYAVGTHRGSYCKLGQAWEEFMSAIVNKGYEVKDGACFELYCDDPMQVPEDKLRTDLFISIKP